MKDRSIQFLALLLSLGFHGVMASLLLLPHPKIFRADTFEVTVEWEKPTQYPDQHHLRVGGTAGQSSSQGFPGSRILRNPKPQPALQARISKSRDDVKEAGRLNTSKNISTLVIATPSLSSLGAGRSNPKSHKKVELLSLVKAGEVGRHDHNKRLPSSQSFFCEANKQNPTPLRATNPLAKDQILKKSYQPLPKYPWICRKRGQEGHVCLFVRTNGEGRVIRARLHKSSGHSALDQAALTAVKEWIFSDYTSQKLLSISFRLNG
jgi:TonB family protein